MPTTADNHNAIALHFRALADLFEQMAKGTAPAPAPAPEADAAPAAGKRGRPAKAKDEAPAEEPKDNSATITADHPKRAELLAVAKDYAAKTDRAKAQAAMKLYGESSSVVPDCDLVDAIKHFKGLIAKLAPAKAESDDL